MQSNDKTNNKNFSQIMVSIAAMVIVLAAVKLAAKVIVPFLLAAFIALLCLPALMWLRQKKVPNALSVLIIVSSIIIVGLVLGLTVGSSVDTFSNHLPEYRKSLTENMAPLWSFFKNTGLDVSELQNSLADAATPSAAMGFAASTFKTASGVLTNSFMILLTVIFILLEAVSMPKKLDRALTDSKNFFSGFESFLTSLKKYILIKTLISFATAVFVTIWLWIIGIDFPVLWGLVAFMFNFVPTVGSIIAAVPPLLLGIVQFGPGAILPVGACYLVVNIVMGNIIEPKVMGEGLGLSTLVVFISLVFWGWILGPVGMLLSIPLTMVVKIACQTSKNYKHIGIILGP